ncbi:hypothetical protein [Streptomyces sp. ISL-63]|uniref:ABC transporter ATP-binding protein n=1 Tax=unclassified Streptomyces TaxID=2593676 RepID=UPI0035ABD862
MLGCTPVVDDAFPRTETAVLVEQSSADEVCGDPQDPYTKQLLTALPALDPGLAAACRAARGNWPQPDSP